MNTLTESEFKSKINDTLIVQFSADWCGPCKTLTQTITTISADLKHPIYKMNIDDHHELSTALRIRSVPTLIRFENGAEIKRLLGNKSADDLKIFAG